MSNKFKNKRHLTTKVNKLKFLFDLYRFYYISNKFKNNRHLTTKVNKLKFFLM